MVNPARPLEHAQLDYDIEDMVEFRRRVHALNTEVKLAEEAESEARAIYRGAKATLEKARARLAASIEEDSRGLPLMEYGRRQAAESDGNGQVASTDRGMNNIPDVDVGKLRLGKLLTALLSRHGYGTAEKLVQLAWMMNMPVNKALQESIGGGIIYEDALKVKLSLIAYLKEHAPEGIAGERKCKGCGCTESYCAPCILATGEQCHWASKDLCSACEVRKP